MKSTRAADIATWLGQLRRVLSGDRPTHVDFLRPYHLVSMAALLLTNGRRMPELNPEISRYAMRMGLWHILGLPDPAPMRRHDPEFRFLPLTEITAGDNNDGAGQRLRNIMIQDQVGRNSADGEAVASILDELINNACEHAGAGMNAHALVCAQVWQNGYLGQIAIADTGRGVRASLGASAEYSEVLAHVNACEFATRYAVTGRRGEGHSGYGLTLAKDLILQNKGTFSVVSHREVYTRDPYRETVIDALDSPYAGTIVVVEWRTDRPLVLRDVYRHWPDSEVDDESFF